MKTIPENEFENYYFYHLLAHDCETSKRLEMSIVIYGDRIGKNYVIRKNGKVVKTRELLSEAINEYNKII